MRKLALLIICAVFLPNELVFASTPQGQSAAQANAETLHAQLLEVEAKQSNLQTRLQELDERLKPENIEKALAGIGSTHPEELRAQRRRELEIERNGVRAQLDLLATSHSRLEKAIARADGEAYRQSAAPPPESAASESVSGNSPTTVTNTPTSPRRAKKKRTKKSKRNVVQSQRL
jgi:hypothetical protein